MPWHSEGLIRTVRDDEKKEEKNHLIPPPPSYMRQPARTNKYGGRSPEEQERRCGLAIDRVRLPADERARI